MLLLRTCADFDLFLSSLPIHAAHTGVFAELCAARFHLGLWLNRLVNTKHRSTNIVCKSIVVSYLDRIRQQRQVPFTTFFTKKKKKPHSVSLHNRVRVLQFMYLTVTPVHVFLQPANGHGLAQIILVLESKFSFILLNSVVICNKHKFTVEPRSTQKGTERSETYS
jgi:hypothetical protein